MECLFRQLLGQEDDVFVRYSLKALDAEKPDWFYLIEYIRERFSIGNWGDVPEFWRKAYSIIRYAMFFNSFKVFKSKHHVECLLYLLDDALIMGHLEELSKEITRAATWAQAVLVQLSMPSDFPKEYADVQPPTITLGNMTRPDEVTSELRRVHRPSLTEFLAILAMGIPVIISGAMSHWPACNPESQSYWSPAYWSKTCGYRTVPVEVGSAYTDENWGQRLMTVNDFFKTFINSENPVSRLGYLAQHQILLQIPELADDVDIPDYCYSGLPEDSSDAKVDSYIWVGPANTVSPLHHDGDRSNLLCQLIGYKYVKLYPADQTEAIYPHTETMLCNTSQIDVAAASTDLKKFPKFAEARGFHGLLGPGEMLFIPPRCWHYIRSMSSSISMNFWWYVAPQFIPKWPENYKI